MWKEYVCWKNHLVSFYFHAFLARLHVKVKRELLNLAEAKLQIAVSICFSSHTFAPLTNLYIEMQVQWFLIGFVAGSFLPRMQPSEERQLRAMKKGKDWAMRKIICATGKISDVFPSVQESQPILVGSYYFSTGNKTSLRSLGCHPLVLLLQGAWANWPMSWLRWHRYLLGICSQAGWTLGDKRAILGISDWYGWKSFLVSIQEISAPHDPLIQWSWLQCGKFLVSRQGYAHVGQMVIQF